MKKPVTSKDPRKPKVVEALKASFVGCRKVTEVYDLGGGFFQGRCLAPNGSKWAVLGVSERRVLGV